METYGRQLPFDYDRRHALSLVGTYRVLRWLEVAGTVRVASGFPYAPVVGLRVAGQAVPDESGEVVGYVPQVDANGLYVWTTDAGGVENRWQFYVEVINLFNRDNAGALNPVLEYDPASDRPRLTEERAGGVPLLPSVGLRVRF